MNAASRAARASAFAALVLAAVWMFWPTGLGGGTVYVTTHGISMEPRFHTGDLAILRAADHYSVGEVVAYRSATLKTTVMHRIVARDGDRFVFKGDNNSWLDPDHPSHNQLLGALWLRIPKGGKTLATLRSPGALLLLGLAGSVFLGGTSPRVRQLRDRRRQRPTRAARAHSLPARALARQAVLVSAGVGLAATAGGAALLALPDTQAVPGTVQVDQVGRFDYTGTAVPGTTYPSGRVQTGDPVYTHLAQPITVSFRDQVTGAGLTDLRGALRLVVTIRTPDGWTGTLTNGATTSLAGGVLAASVRLDPAYATDVVQRHIAEVGTAGGSATLTVTPKISLTGAVLGQAFVAAAPAGISFDMSATALVPAESRAATFAPTVSTPVRTTSVVPRRLQLLSIHVPIGPARILDAVVLAVSVVVLAVAAWIGRKRSGDVADEILLRTAARILPVTGFTPGASVVDVSDAESLRRVAERLDTVVLHLDGEDGHTFAVRDMDTTYRFVLPTSTKPHPPPPPGPVTRPLPRIPATVLSVVRDDPPASAPAPTPAPTAASTPRHRSPSPRPAVPAPRGPRLPPLPARPRSRSGGDIGDLGAMFG